MSADYRPSDVRLEAPALLAGTMRKAEAEFAAALMVLACRAQGDFWQPVTGDQVVKALRAEDEAGTAIGRMAHNPLFKPSINEVVDRGFARWRDDHTAEFTNAGFEAMRRWVRPRTMEERVARLLRQFQVGERVRAVQAIFYGTGEEVAEGTCGYVQETHVLGCSPLVKVAWDGRGRPGEPPHIMHPVLVEHLDPERPS